MQHDSHVGLWINHIFDRLLAELFAPAEFGWNEWARHAAKGEWT